MRSIATAAAIMIMSATAWADEPERRANANTAIDNEPIVLSAAEMDGVTGGSVADGYYIMLKPLSRGETTSGGEKFTAVVNHLKSK